VFRSRDAWVEMVALRTDSQVGPNKRQLVRRASVGWYVDQLSIDLGRVRCRVADGNIDQQLDEVLVVPDDATPGQQAINQLGPRPLQALFDDVCEGQPEFRVGMNE
jgi:hypothetical protein